MRRLHELPTLHQMLAGDPGSEGFLRMLLIGMQERCFSLHSTSDPHDLLGYLGCIADPSGAPLRFDHEPLEQRAPVPLELLTCAWPANWSPNRLLMAGSWISSATRRPTDLPWVRNPPKARPPGNGAPSPWLARVAARSSRAGSGVTSRCGRDGHPRAHPAFWDVDGLGRLPGIHMAGAA